MWDEEDGFYYDVLRLPNGQAQRLKVRSMVGLLPLCAATTFEGELMKRYPEIGERLRRFLEARPELRTGIHDPLKPGVAGRRLGSILNENRLRRVHQGQFEGRKKRISPHLSRAQDEPLDSGLRHFYERLLTILRQPAVRDGNWQLLDCTPAWDGNWTNDCFVCFSWKGPSDEQLLVAVNYASNQSQCRLWLPCRGLTGSAWQLKDELSDACYDRDGNDLQENGIFLDLAPWQAQGFRLTHSV